MERMWKGLLKTTEMMCSYKIPGRDEPDHRSKDLEW